MWNEWQRGIECNRNESLRSLVMRGCCLALDRPDIAHACKELARNMSAPKQWDWNGLKRLCRYLKGVPRLVWRYHDQGEQDRFTMLTDSDDAGCAKTRKSTSAGPGALMHSSHLIIFYSGTQHLISLSSRESEFYAGIKAGSTLLEAISMALDLGELRKGLDFWRHSCGDVVEKRARPCQTHRSHLWPQQCVHGDLQQTWAPNTWTNDRDALCRAQPFCCGKAA